MRILIVLLFIAMIAFASRPATKEGPCPPKDVVVTVLTPMGYLHVDVKKGFFNKDKEGENYVSLETYNEMMKEEAEAEEEPSDEEDETQPI